ncbi:hypothetical protein NPIL_513221 [Nephila pilipes]|uniref:Uncharacterized protein n=1 Tax=Nephila pilipes TaxID=299642 RepID=A0A8X6TDM4_NEPPI|nr:hypothetical protein NPIL_513221 [Nephila pilipes]
MFHASIVSAPEKETEDVSVQTLIFCISMMKCTSDAFITSVASALPSSVDDSLAPLPPDRREMRRSSFVRTRADKR